MPYVILAVYSLVSFVLLIYSCVEFILLLNFLFRKKTVETKVWKSLPNVTIQLPLYNEKFVVERLIDAIVQIDYPKEKLEIQVLDDSTDETIEKAKAKVAMYQAQGFDIHYIQREDRSGFKAGALDYGLRTSKGEFIAIFDADFLPARTFLMDAIPHFSDDRVGVVQSRWGYLNENYSFLTRLQTVILNTHFSVEQAGRNKSKAYINFNGTAGIWSKKCIDDAGGWMADTLTEDLDLSFRAQMKGWKFKYVMEIESPSELPITFPGYKAQQFRWAKGAAECVKKNLSSLWKSSASFWAKMIGSFHLLNSSVYLVVLSFILLSFPMSYALQEFKGNPMVDSLLPFFLLSNVLLLCVFVGGNLYRSKSPVQWLAFPFIFLGFLIVNMGMSLYMSIGVIEGYLGKKSEFVRTPKFNVLAAKKAGVQAAYTKITLTPLNMIELLIAGYGVFQLTYSLMIGDVFGSVFAAMFTIGFGYNVGSTVYHASFNKS